MCVVSMVYDHQFEKWHDRTPPGEFILPNHGLSPIANPLIINPITQEEVDEFRRLLERARAYDRKHNQPDCEMEEKKRLIRELAKLHGLNVDFIDDAAEAAEGAQL